MDKWAVSFIISMIILCGILYGVLGISKYFGIDYNELFKSIGSLLFVIFMTWFIREIVFEDDD